jgi:CubicO group peptidase (beta-lactamase class C family)
LKIRSLCTTAIALLFATASYAQTASAPLPRSTPEAQGIPTQAIIDFVHQADSTVDTFDSFMILRHGRVIAEGYWKPAADDVPHILNSVSKSFNATAIGLAIHEHKLKLTDHVLQFFPADAPPNPSANLQAMTVRDLLTMSGGDAVEPKAINGDPSVRQFLAQPVVYPPGTHFQYNAMGAYTLSAIVTRVTGQTTLEFLKPRLFAPLGIQNPRWDASTEGNSLGGYGLYLRTEDIAKFGQLYLQKGKWNGRQLIPRQWVEQATSKQIDNEHESHAKIGPDWVQGYGFQFWRCRHNAYRADGAGGQFIVVMPDQDAVVAITANTGNLEGELNAIWDNLLPAFQPNPLPPNPAAQQKLAEALSTLTAHPKKPQP